MPRQKKPKATPKTNYIKTASNVAGLALKVAKLYSMLNTEKKRFDVALNGVVVAQESLNASGVATVDITPIPVQGVAFNQRTGSSIKVHSSIMKVQMWQQTNNTHTTRLRVEYWLNKGPTISAALLLTQLYNASSASGIIDYFSQLDPDYTGTARRILQRKFINKPQFQAEISVTDMIVPMRYKHHVRFDDNSVTVTDGQLVMFIFADTGNSNAVVSTLSNVPILTALSGLIFNMDQKYYYYDK